MMISDFEYEWTVRAHANSPAMKRAECALRRLESERESVILPPPLALSPIRASWVRRLWFRIRHGRFWMNRLYLRRIGEQLDAVERRYT